MYFWNMKPYSLVDTCQHFRGTYSIHFRDKRLDSKDGDSRFLRNVDKVLLN
jgi:hypothetical protein